MVSHPRVGVTGPNNTALPPTQICTIEDVCGFGGFHGKEPNQWWRFITPVFLHAGIIHLAFNMLAQWTISAQVCNAFFTFHLWSGRKLIAHDVMTR